MHDEIELRQYLRDHVRKATIQWVEPGRYGSTMGAADCILRHNDTKDVSLELKIWKTMRRGIKCEMRPIQRRWHHVTMKEGGRCAVLFCIDGTYLIYLVRGDHVPLRPYANDHGSGIGDGILVRTKVENNLEVILFGTNSGFWNK